MVPDGGDAIWTAGWIAWLFFFAIWEGIPLFGGKRGRTLSEHVWAWLRIGNGDPRPPLFTWVLRILLIVGWVWLGPHLLLGKTIWAG